MKLKIIITLLLFLFSLCYLHQSTIFIKQNDALMKEIERKQSLYNTKEVNAIITLHTMIPGISGKKVNLDKSYQKMKKLNKFNESLLVYDTITPSSNIQDIYDKVIISGNKQKNNISLVIKVDNQKLFNLINSVLIDNNIYVDILSSDNYSLLNTHYQSILSEKYYSFTNYCLTNDINIIKECQINKKKTVLGININNYYLSKTKELVQNGVILVYHFTENNYQELNVVIHYLKNNNYYIVPISELINE